MLARRDSAIGFLMLRTCLLYTSKDIGEATGMLTDCGGGSTEVSLFTGDTVIFADTMPIGSLNSYYNHVKGIFPTEEELRDIKADTESMLNRLNIPDGIIPVSYTHLDVYKRQL